MDVVCTTALHQAVGIGSGKCLFFVDFSFVVCLFFVFLFVVVACFHFLVVACFFVSFSFVFFWKKKVPKDKRMTFDDKHKQCALHQRLSDSFLELVF